MPHSPAPTPTSPFALLLIKNVFDHNFHDTGRRYRPWSEDLGTQSGEGGMRRRVNIIPPTFGRLRERGREREQVQERELEQVRERELKKVLERKRDRRMDGEENGNKDEMASSKEKEGYGQSDNHKKERMRESNDDSILAEFDRLVGRGMGRKERKREREREKRQRSETRQALTESSHASKSEGL